MRRCHVCGNPVLVGVDPPDSYRSYWPPGRGHLPPVVYHTACVPQGVQGVLFCCARCHQTDRAPGDSYCRECRSEVNREWRAANPERVREHNARTNAQRVRPRNGRTKGVLARLALMLENSSKETP